MGNLENALDDLNEAIRLASDNNSFYYHRGIVYAKMRMFNEAVEDYTRIIG